ncbi:MAG TPA: hypothetical protein VM694_06230 [Polyangium sp.]|nr:hypothetical protein [Polyangium sp.]
MEGLVSLLVVLLFLMMPVLPALLARAARKAQERAAREVAAHRRALLGRTPPSPPLPDRRSPVKYQLLEEIPARPVSLEEALPAFPSALDADPAPPRRRRTSQVLLEKPGDVRRAILLGALLGPPRGAD